MLIVLSKHGSIRYDVGASGIVSYIHHARHSLYQLATLCAAYGYISLCTAGILYSSLPAAGVSLCQT